MRYPLFVGLSYDAQATAVASTTEAQLLKPGGIVTTPLATGQQWDVPNGWAPLQWIAISGMRHYGQTALAQTIACRWMRNINTVYDQSGYPARGLAPSIGRRPASALTPSGLSPPSEIVGEAGKCFLKSPSSFTDGVGRRT